MDKKMHWNYRIVKMTVDCGEDKFVTYGLHEVYYNKNNEPFSMTINPITFEYDVEDDDQEAKNAIIENLERALEDAKKHPIFVEPEKWAEDDNELEGTILVQDKDDNIIEFFCPKCNGIVQPHYGPINSLDDETELEDKRHLACYSCHHTVDLESLGLEELREGSGS
jgi:hypothetical protein